MNESHRARGPVWLIRHGDADAPPRTCLGLRDVGLRDRAQTAGAMRRWAETIGTADAVYASDLRRAADTARPLAAALECPLRLDRDLRELDFGTWDGMTWSAIEKADPARYARFMASWRVASTPGGEGYPDLERRVVEAWRRITGACPRLCVVIVAHGGSLRALAAHLLALPPEQVMAKPLPPGGGFRIDVD